MRHDHVLSRKRLRLLGESAATLGIESPVSMYIYCDDVNALHTRAVAAGATSIKAPEDTFWGDRYCNLVDPDGHSWGFGTKLADASEQPKAG